MKKSKITILYGNAGSGKTTYAKEQLAKSNINLILCDLDKEDLFIRRKRTKEETCRMIADNVVHVISRNKNLIIDGLIYTNKQVHEIINYINKYKDIKDKFDLEIVYWESDVEKCLHNDKFRRTVSSEITIKNAKVEVPNKEKIGMEFALITKQIVMKSVKELKFQEFVYKINTQTKYQFNIQDGVLYGSEWSGGGSSGNCWNDKMSYHNAEEPLLFDDFPKLIEIVSPDIKYLDCYNIIKKCCSVQQNSSSDYYGGHSTSYKHVCDLRILHEELENLKYIVIS